MEGKGEIIIYETGSSKARLEVLESDTVWLNQNQIADLFGTKRPAITKHLANIFKANELQEDSVSSISELTAKDGKMYRTKFYNLDAIISIGYRVKFFKGNSIPYLGYTNIKDHLVKGYTINEKRLQEQQEKYDKIGYQFYQ